MNVSPIRAFLNSTGGPPVLWCQWLEQFHVYFIASGFHKEPMPCSWRFCLTALEEKDSGFFLQSLAYVIGSHRFTYETLWAANKVCLLMWSNSKTWAKYRWFHCCFTTASCILQFWKSVWPHDPSPMLFWVRKRQTPKFELPSYKCDNVPLEKIINKANAIESASKDVKDIDRTLRSSSGSVHQISEAKKKHPKKCNAQFFCFLLWKWHLFLLQQKGHRAGFASCPAKNKKCKTCWKVGHFSVVQIRKVSSKISR